MNKNFLVESLSVFFPAYNEAENISTTVKSAREYLDKLSIPWEIIIVDDGSTDRTGEIADQLVKNDKRVRVIHKVNGGYGTALRAGLEAAKYQWIAYNDSDGQFNIAELDKFFPFCQDYDAIWGYRIKRRDSLTRVIFGLVWRASVLILLKLPLRDPDCGFKMFRKSIVEKILPLESTRGAMINAELPLKIQKAGGRIKEVGVSHYPRKEGKPTGANFAVIVSSYIELLRLWWKTR